MYFSNVHSNTVGLLGDISLWMSYISILLARRDTVILLFQTTFIKNICIADLEGRDGIFFQESRQNFDV